MTLVSDSSDRQPSPRRSGGSAERSLELISLLTREGRAMTLAQLADALSLPKPTVHRLCARLVELDYLMRDLDERQYTVGPALHNLAFDTLSHGIYSRLRHNVLSDLVADIGETCNFTTIDGASILYLDRVEAERPWRLTLSVGVHVPLHCTASGKLFLSQLEPSERRKLLDSLELRALTGNTVTDRNELEAHAVETAAQDYATDIEEFIVGLIAVAVPVRDSDGRLRAAIAMHCPVTHVDLDQAISRLPALRAAARLMSELLEL